MARGRGSGNLWRWGWARATLDCLYLSFFLLSFVLFCGCFSFFRRDLGEGNRGAPLGRYGSLWVAASDTGRG